MSDPAQAPLPKMCTASKAGTVCRLPWGHEERLHDSNPTQTDMDKVGRVQWSPAIKERVPPQSGRH